MATIDRIRAEQERRKAAQTGGAASAGASVDRLQAELERRRQAGIAKQAVVGWQGPEDTVIPGLHIARGAQALGDLARVGVGQGLGLGWGDEAMAALQSLGGTPYQEALQQQQDALTASKARMDADNPYTYGFMANAPSLAYGGGKTAWSSALKGYGLGTASSVGHGETDPLKAAGAGLLGAVLGAAGSGVGNLPNLPNALKPAAGTIGYGLGEVAKKPLGWIGLFTHGPVGGLAGLAAQKAARAGGRALDQFSVGPQVTRATDTARDWFARMMTLGGRQATDQ